MKIQVVVGGQFGSEAKGHVTRQLVDDHLLGGGKVLNVRVAGPNAGHIAYDPLGNRWPLRQVPVGGTNPDGNVNLYIAPGSEIDLPVLLDEIDSMDDAGLGVSDRLTVDPEATMLYDEHKFREAGMHERIGSTGKGIGAARADRIMRTGKRLIDDASAVATLRARGVRVASIPPDAAAGWQGPLSVIVEGTQGYGLGLHAGHYPQCTSSDARAIDFLAMVGYSPWHAKVEAFEVWVVARAYPIRVAGNSGELVGETTWDELGLEPEKTTVTQKIRRVGQWDRDLIHDAVAANGGAPVVRIALTMADQKFPWIEHQGGDYDRDFIGRLVGRDQGDIANLEDWINTVEIDANAPVRMITTSPTTALFRGPINDGIGR